ncbi:MAG: Jag N-terminal domain-containing protein, partial [Eubacteriales bacterium]|nr:Jag N-terminal domain-containing protein [Eubacteriales bacterium]
MKIEKTAKTVNIAIDEALKELNTTIDKIEYEVIQEPSKGFLGILSKPAKVVVKLKEDNNKIVNENSSEKYIEKKIPKMVTEDEFKKEKKEQKELNKNADK